MPSPSFLSWGSTPHRSDTINTLLKRIAGGLADGTTGGGGGESGFGPPGSLVAEDGVTYWDKTGKILWIADSTVVGGWYQALG